MNFIHAVKTLPRLVDDPLAARLSVMPAVVLTGARQTGKNALVETLVSGGTAVMLACKTLQARTDQA